MQQFEIKLKSSEVQHFNIASELIKQISKKFPNYKMFLVGGACRDLFTRYFFDEDKRINDLDFSIFDENGHGLDKEELIELMNFILLDRQYAVVDETYFLHLKVIHLETKFEMEFTSCRNESYRENRKPETSSGSIYSDIKRRDFTVNAIYLDIKDIKENNIVVQSAISEIEPFILDVKSRILKTTDEPMNIFMDDPLRLMRAIRFKGYGFDLEIELEKTIHDFPSMIIFERVSKERIAIELLNILDRGDIDYFINYGLVKKIIPEFMNFDDKEYKETELIHIVEVIKQARILSNPEDRMIFLLVALLHDIGKGHTGTYSESKQRWQFLGHEEESTKMAEVILKRLKFSNSLIRDVTNIISQHMTTKFFNQKPLKTIIMWILKFRNHQKYPNLIKNVLRFNKMDWGGKPKEWQIKNKHMMDNEIFVSERILILRQKIDEMFKEHGDFKRISNSIGMDSFIPPSSKAKAILKRHAGFIIGRLHEEKIDII